MAAQQRRPGPQQEAGTWSWLGYILCALWPGHFEGTPPLSHTCSRGQRKDKDHQEACV